ncbi:DUF2214 domain-containing protein [Chryseotalea sanaruensis]|uniref:DUF2214 domain-containing protein n=1 Tax=Chryseotalea sanaruensis TaxID=2482724 RepID=A0A401UDH5_9BACT|nr:DUF2214 family protein [Chryseotalea sanaruensis]GCC52934.1 DUF2214 domain-containing protein [Chryseotalea sanaruensis]
MTLEIFLRYIHFVSIFAIVSSLVAEHLLLKKEMTPAEIKRLSKIDAVYGIAALTLLGAGLTLWLGEHGKPAAFYTNNWVFLLKVGLFTVVGLLSIYPTIFFLSKRKSSEEKIVIPAILVWMVRMELLLLFIIPLLAGLMAKSVGYLG